MRGVFYRTEKDGTPLATPELRISATNNRTVYYDNQNAKEAALQNDEIKEGSIVLTGYADGESEVVIKQELDWEHVQSFTAQQLFDEYTAPEDGVVYITGRCATATASWITINHQKVGYYFGGSGGIIDCQVDSQINKGDVITSSNLLTADYSGIFVPFKTVGEPLTLPVNINTSEERYSLAETKTNKIWIDGKSIYRKVIDFGILPNNTNKKVSTGITNMSWLVNVYGIACRSSSKMYFPIGFSSTSTSGLISCTYDAETNEVTVTTVQDRRDFTECYIILEYTKTN